MQLCLLFFPNDFMRLKQATETTAIERYCQRRGCVWDFDFHQDKRDTGIK